MSKFVMEPIEPPLLLSEQQISDYLIREVLRHHKETLLLKEINILLGATRIDHLMVGKTLHGIEIKSDLDDLQRLKRQVAQYLRVVEFLTIVATPQNVMRISRILPDQVGLMLVYHKHKEEKLCHLPIRVARVNTGRDPQSLVQLLWKNEVIAILRQIGCEDQVLTGMPRQQLWQQLAELVSIEKLSGLVIERLKQRYQHHHHRLKTDIAHRDDILFL
ncbi:MAG: hypothetical protein DI535_22745 [Citrobacter freundii]|nr:MAG: hypothetical protein DI535_22745 [Citrobacter freundii]